MTWGVLLGRSSTGCVSCVTPWGSTKRVSCWEVVVSLVLSSSPLILPCTSPPGISQLLIRWTASVQSAASRIVRGLIPTSHGLEWGNVTIVNLAPFFQCVLPLTFFWDCVTSPKHMSCSSIMLQQPGQLASYTAAYGLVVHKLGWHNWHVPVLQDYQSDPAEMSN